PVAGVDVLVRRPEVDEELAGMVEHQQIRDAVRKTALPHLPPRDDPDRAAGVVEDVDQLGAGVPGHGVGSSNRPPTAASSSGVFTLVRLAAAPCTRATSSSLT